MAKRCERLLMSSVVNNKVKIWFMYALLVVRVFCSRVTDSEEEVDSRVNGGVCADAHRSGVESSAPLCRSVRRERPKQNATMATAQHRLTPTRRAQCRAEAMKKEYLCGRKIKHLFFSTAPRFFSSPAAPAFGFKLFIDFIMFHLCAGV